LLGRGESAGVIIEAFRRRRQHCHPDHGCPSTRRSGCAATPLGAAAKVRKPESSRLDHG
jgi:hypothetical protein